MTGAYMIPFIFENNLIYIGTKHSDYQRKDLMINLLDKGFTHDFFEANNHDKIEFFHKHGDKPETILFLGGNAEDALLNIDLIDSLFPGHSIFTLNYPGFGLSEGASDENVITDLLQEFVTQKKLDKTPLIVIGRSLGTGFATKVSSTFSNVEKLILVSPYYSMENIAVSAYPFIPKAFTSMFMKNKIETFKYAQDVTVPVLIIYAKDDKVVYNRHTEDLIDYFQNTKTILIENESHNSVLYSSKTLTAIREFTND